ncbi:MAG: FkbM family methyltransferase [Candidatus Omnitrophica bacterium]|nr:FkbM family methyltransferase [Candidatus Omnitrophota bacterium]
MTTLNGMSNLLRQMLARAIAGGIFYPWRACEKILRRPLGAAAYCHHLILGVLRRLRQSWRVSVRYRNVVDSSKCLRLELNLCQTTQLWHFRTAGRYDAEWLGLIAAGMPSADCFVDVGAHLGWYAMTIAQAYPSKRVLAVEPDPDNHRALCAHLLLNGLERIDVPACAIASRNRSAAYFRNPLNDGGGGLRPLEEFRSGPRQIRAETYCARHPAFRPTVTVACRRLDELVNGPCILKIDVEGAELDVLYSAEGLLAKQSIRLMVIEVWREQRGEVIRYLSRFGIECFLYGASEPLAPEAGTERRIVDLLALDRRWPASQQILQRMGAWPPRFPAHGGEPCANSPGLLDATPA